MGLSLLHKIGLLASAFVVFLGMLTDYTHDGCSYESIGHTESGEEYTTIVNGNDLMITGIVLTFLIAGHAYYEYRKK
jgi:hypothetical protein